MSRQHREPTVTQLEARAWEDYNSALYRWRRGTISNQETRSRLKSATERMLAARDRSAAAEWHKYQALARFCWAARRGIPDDAA
jgi:hypothetical protein